MAKKAKRVSVDLATLDRSDAEIGAAIRKLFHEAQAKFTDNEIDACDVCARILAGVCFKLGATDTEIKIGGFTANGVPAGDWIVSIRQEGKP